MREWMVTAIIGGQTIYKRIASDTAAGATFNFISTSTSARDVDIISVFLVQKDKKMDGFGLPASWGDFEQI